MWLVGGTLLGLRATNGSTYQIVPVDPVDRGQSSAFVRALYQDFLKYFVRAQQR